MEHEQLRYGDHAEQVADLYVPDGDGPFGAVVLWHGGSFEAAYGRSMLAPAAESVAARGLVALNVTYRRTGCGGGWPETFDDARAALALLGEVPAADPADVTVLGFSAGLPLAVHAARTATTIRPRRLIDVAGVSLLQAAAEVRGPASGAWRLLGDPARAPEAYAGADPAAALPLGIPIIIVHGDADELVPPAMSREWAARRARRGTTSSSSRSPVRATSTCTPRGQPAGTPSRPGWSSPGSSTQLARSGSILAVRESGSAV